MSSYPFFVIPAPLASEASKRESAGTHMWTVGHFAAPG
jgi:hypothetical protein